VETAPDVGAAWQRLTAATPAARPAPAPAPRRSRAGGFLRRPAVAAVAVAVVLAGGSTAAANRWLRIFQTDRIAAISVSTADLIAVPDLTRYGDLEVTGDTDPREVPDAATAAAQTGLTVPRPTFLPRGVTGEPEYRVGGEVTATFTFRADRAAQTAREFSATLPPPPPGLDGSEVRLVGGPRLVAMWSHSSGVPALAVGRAVAPKAYSTGISFEVLRDYLLTLPGMPEEVARELKAFSADGSTLPLPVPAERITTSTADVQGVPATVLATTDKTLAAVLWVRDGVVTAVAGAVSSDEALETARGLR
jgi:hypothetical protein